MWGGYPGRYVSIVGRTDVILGEDEDSCRQHSVTKEAVPQRELHTSGEAEGTGASISQLKDKQAEVAILAQNWAARQCQHRVGWGADPLWGIWGPSPPPSQPPAGAAARRTREQARTGSAGSTEAPRATTVFWVSPHLADTW